MDISNALDKVNFGVELEERNLSHDKIIILQPLPYTLGHLDFINRGETIP